MTPEITAALAITAIVLTLYGLWKVFEKAGERGLFSLFCSLIEMI